MNTQPETKKKYDRTGEPVNLAVVQAALTAFKAAVESLDTLEKLMLADKFDKQYVIDGGKMGLDGHKIQGRNQGKY